LKPVSVHGNPCFQTQFSPLHLFNGDFQKPTDYTIFTALRILKDCPQLEKGIAMEIMTFSLWDSYLQPAFGLWFGQGIRQRLRALNFKERQFGWFPEGGRENRSVHDINSTDSCA
jgi:hypothetical protein